MPDLLLTSVAVRNIRRSPHLYRDYSYVYNGGSDCFAYPML